MILPSFVLKAWNMNKFMSWLAVTPTHDLSLPRCQWCLLELSATRCGLRRSDTRPLICSQSVAEQVMIRFETVWGWLRVTFMTAVQPEFLQIPLWSWYLDQTGGSNEPRKVSSCNNQSYVKGLGGTKNDHQLCNVFCSRFFHIFIETNSLAKFVTV